MTRNHLSFQLAPANEQRHLVLEILLQQQGYEINVFPFNALFCFQYLTPACS